MTIKAYTLAITIAVVALMFGSAITNAQTADAPAAASASTSQLSALDANFVAQANLGAPFQIELREHSMSLVLARTRRSLCD